MRVKSPFQPDDLHELGQFLDRADTVAMEDVYDVHPYDHLVNRANIIGLRHDCDNVIAPAVHLAEWEADRGIRSTYYILHTAPYWRKKTTLRAALERIAECGHEIGLHNDAVTVALETGHEPARILEWALSELRGYGHEIRSTVAHGNARCRVDNYVNDEMFTECYRADYGPISRLGIDLYPLSSFGLDFDANWLPRGDYISDSGGQWSQPFEEVTREWPARGQLHMLVHPDWWAEAFHPAEVAA